MGRRNVVGAGADIEESGRPLGRVGTGVEGAMVGQHVGAQAGDPAVTGSRQLGGHMIVAREGRGQRFSMRSSTPFTGTPTDRKSNRLNSSQSCDNLIPSHD